MAYTKTNWQNGVTPINETNLNKIENQLQKVDILDYAPTTIPSNSDLNNYKEPGIYRTTSNTITNSLTNCPLTGRLIELEVKLLNDGTILRQTIRDFASSSGELNLLPRIYTRAYNESNSLKWSSWINVMTTNDVYGPGIDGILTNSDLNDYKTPGRYETNSSSVTRTLANCPFDGRGAVLVVEKMYRGGSTICYNQTITGYPLSSSEENMMPIKYIRTYNSTYSNNGGWSEWVQVNSSTAEKVDNGGYTKMSDGTLICYGKIDSSNYDSTNKVCTNDWTFPIPFKYTPCVSATPLGANSNGYFAITNPTLTGVRVQLKATSKDDAGTYIDSSGRSIQIIAIGRWK